MSNFPMANVGCSKEPLEFCGESVGLPGASTGSPTIPVAQLIPLDFTYVVYDASQHHSLLLAYLTFLPIVVGIGLINAVILRRDIEAAYHSLGLLLSTAINTVLKRIFAQARPAGSAKLGHGMPSDHSQFSFFFVVYFSYWIIHRARLTKQQRILYICGLVSLAFIVCWSRIHLGVHTTAQVCVGGAIGATLGLLWGAWAKVCVWTHIFPLIERSSFGRRWYLKDCSQLPVGIHSSHEFEYNAYVTQRKTATSPTNGHTEKVN